ncbi:outer membrane beta-barrel protein [Maribacter sp. SA7]|uniref:outer membrane protein n=1 Tax=Maribacter zhoushanensis TaxID=3030012 RepID=UPI0023EAC8BD|nr:outer membrane beta-barrel protein [Maribacter zhoushanensis]MDF4203989.1 outer membrane beta-barrel protein [Maribacter zhoushanensis]
MKQKIFWTLSLLIITITSHSQDSKITAELNYPIPIDNNFLGENFNGIVDLGIKFRFIDLNPIKVGASFNGGILTRKTDFQGANVSNYILQPRIFGELNLESIEKIHPHLGLGYTIMVFDFAGGSDNQNGFNLNFGFTYDFSEKFFAQLQYDFVRLGVEDNVPNTKFNTNVNILKIGIGYRL